VQSIIYCDFLCPGNNGVIKDQGCIRGDQLFGELLAAHEIGDSMKSTITLFLFLLFAFIGANHAAIITFDDAAGKVSLNNYAADGDINGTNDVIFST